MAFTLTDYRRRQTNLKRRLATQDLDYAVTTDAAHLRYLVGYTGSNGLLLLGNGTPEFYTDGRYREQARRQVRGARVNVVRGGDLLVELSRYRGFSGGRPKIGYEPHLLNERSAQRMRESAKKALFVPMDNILEPLMQVKDAAEIACIKEAAAIADTAFEHALTVIRPGVRERDVAAELEYRMMRSGSERVAFETIVASGPRSALPHGLASDRKITSGDFVTLDFGATVDGYVSDITRTVVVGRATPRQKRVHALVRRAHQRAITRARAGIRCSALDRAARNLIARAGFGNRFDHGLGHGIGLIIHEGPGINPRSEAVLKTGMVVTIEPGVYFPGWGGVRIEDDVLIRPRGCTVITQSPRELIEL